MCFFVQYFHSKFLNNIAHTKKYDTIYTIQMGQDCADLLNRHPVPVKLNNTWKQVKERKGEKK